MEKRYHLENMRSRPDPYLRRVSQCTPRFPRTQAVEVSDDSLTVSLDDGRTISLPLGWYPRLLHATPEERKHWRLIADGVGIQWPDLDEDISVDNFLAGQPSGEGQRSFKRWLAQRSHGCGPNGEA